MGEGLIPKKKNLDLEVLSAPNKPVKPVNPASPIKYYKALTSPDSPTHIPAIFP